MSAQGVHFLDAAAPEGTRLYVIGDVHGMHGLLSLLLDAIDAEIADDRPDDYRIIMLGDYTDRGPNSREVIDTLIGRRSDPQFITLAGNHDDGFLDFMAEPRQSTVFARHGGEATAASYGAPFDTRDEASVIAAGEALGDLVPETHKHFLRTLPDRTSFGDFFFCHAGIRPGIALEAQSRADLTWIRSEFLDEPRLFDKLVVHGHTPCRRPEMLPNRINIDTGAHRHGVLTALVAEGLTKRFLHASEDGIVSRKSES
jgi:serine/threonine protein phosphatase 1